MAAHWRTPPRWPITRRPAPPSSMTGARQHHPGRGREDPPVAMMRRAGGLKLHADNTSYRHGDEGKKSHPRAAFCGLGSWLTAGTRTPARRRARPVRPLRAPTPPGRRAAPPGCRAAHPPAGTPCADDLAGYTKGPYCNQIARIPCPGAQVTSRDTGCNGPDRGSNFAPARKGADFREVVAGAGWKSHAVRKKWNAPVPSPRSWGVRTFDPSWAVQASEPPLNWAALSLPILAERPICCPLWHSWSEVPQALRFSPCARLLR